MKLWNDYEAMEMIIMLGYLNEYWLLEDSNYSHVRVLKKIKH